jgi:hypothetical protein
MFPVLRGEKSREQESAGQRRPPFDRTSIWKAKVKSGEKLERSSTSRHS